MRPYCKSLNLARLRVFWKTTSSTVKFANFQSGHFIIFGVKTEKHTIATRKLAVGCTVGFSMWKIFHLCSWYRRNKHERQETGAQIQLKNSFSIFFLSFFSNNTNADNSNHLVENFHLPTSSFRTTNPELQEICSKSNTIGINPIMVWGKPN